MYENSILLSILIWSADIEFLDIKNHNCCVKGFIETFIFIP